MDPLASPLVCWDELFVARCLRFTLLISFSLSLIPPFPPPFPRTNPILATAADGAIPSNLPGCTTSSTILFDDEISHGWCGNSCCSTTPEEDDACYYSQSNEVSKVRKNKLQQLHSNSVVLNSNTITYDITIIR